MNNFFFLDVRTRITLVHRRPAAAISHAHQIPYSSKTRLRLGEEIEDRISVMIWFLVSYTPEETWADVWDAGDTADNLL